MNTKLVSAIAALLATTALASAAEAGGDGVRLGFGFPLGTFKATPAQGGGGSYLAPKHRKVPVQHQARGTPDKAAPRVTKAETPKDASKTVAEKSETTTTTAATATEETPRVTGSSALIQSSIPVHDQADQAPAADVAAAESTGSVASSSTGHATGTSGDCQRKFIPAIGTTVSVGCGE